MFLPGESNGQRSLAGYSPWGSQKVRHHRSDLARTQADSNHSSTCPGSQPFTHACRCPMRRPSEAEDVPYSEEDAVVMETAQVQIGLR